MTAEFSVFRRAERWMYIFRSHRPTQLGWRACSLLQRRLFPLLPKSRYLDVDADSVVRRENPGYATILERHLKLRMAAEGFADRADQLSRGDFCFLGETRHLGQQAKTPLSEVARVSHLWRFQLHYQESLLDILASHRQRPTSEMTNQIWPIVDGWIRANPITRRGALGDAWHPFCLSRRIPVWLLLWQAGIVPLEEVSRFKICLESQVRYLERHLEWDLRGNHLWENLKAVLLAGAFLDGPVNDRRIAVFKALIRRQFEEQLLPTGEHFERSPMYHAQLLSTVLDLRDAFTTVDQDFAECCGDVAGVMAEFLTKILHPDGQIPLLADSALAETPSPGLLIADATEDDLANQAAPELRSHRFGMSAIGKDYWTWRDANDFLVFDHGPLGADELPAHAHNDLLTFEASFNGTRVIVDSGVYDYEDSPMRRRCRSTAAHNVLQVDDLEHSDLWSRFRMGRRGYPGETSTGSTGDFQWVRATHNAFAYGGIPQVGRWIACRPGGPWIVVDWADCASGRRLTNWLHLSPEVVLTDLKGHSAELRLPDWAGTISFLTPGILSVEESLYCPNFGVQHAAAIIRYTCGREVSSHPNTQAQLLSMSAMVWVLSWGDARAGVALDAPHSNDPNLICQSNDARVSWPLREIVYPPRE